MQQPTTSNRLRPFRPMPFGRYTLLMPLSMGGMGEIFLARIDGPQGFEKLCVIKKILPHLAEDKDFVSRFHNEAHTLAKLTHGSIAQVLDMGQQQGEPYLALEYIDGKDLRKVGARFRERGMPMPLTFVLFVMGRVLDALAYAHRKRDDDDKEIGLVHRDMSPQNILISYEGEVKVIDFGLAKSTLNASKTNPSIILGKFLYMSPEQAKHAKVDRRSDLYAVGLCLYELIAGKNPFEDIPPHALMAAVANPNIPHVQQVEPLCPSNIAQIIMKALSPDPAQRFQTAEELRGKLIGALLEIDSAAGPESCSRFMRDMFSAEYQAERKLLTQLKEAARVEVKTDTANDPPTPAPTQRISQIRPLPFAKGAPVREPPPADEATPGPTDLRKYGLEPTAPRGSVLETTPLSFAPTPKVGGAAADKSNEGDRETMPGIIIDRSVEGTVRIIGQDDERETGPHVQLYTSSSVTPSPEMMHELPTRPQNMGVPQRATPFPGHNPSNVTSPAIEPVTSEANVVAGPSEPDLPSVVVSGVSSLSVPKPQPGAARPQPVKTASVLVPASSVRTPEVVAPLPKALEGKRRPDGDNVTDRGTRSRRTNVFVVLVPVLAFLALAAVVGWDVIKAQLRSEEEEQYKDSLLKTDFDDNKRKKLKEESAYQDPAPHDLDPLPAPPKTTAPQPPPPAPPPAAEPAAKGEDDLAPLAPAPAVKEAAPPRVMAKRLPKTNAAKELLKLRALFNAKQNLMEERQANGIIIKMNGYEQRVESAPANSPAEKQLLKDMADTKAKLETVK